MALLNLLKKSNKKYTIMVVPNNSATMKSFKVKHNSIRLSILSVLFVFVCLIAWGTYMTLRPNHSEQYDTLIRENLDLENKLTSVKTKVALLETNLDRLERFDRKLRVMTNFADYRRKMGIGPVSEEEMLISKIENQVGNNEALALKLKEKVGSLSSANLPEEINRLLKESEVREKDLAELNNFLEDQRLLLSHVPSIKPSDGWYTSGFGYRINPFTSAKKLHEGIDIASNIGTPVHAPADGTVIYAGNRSAYGIVIVINHGFGITTRYAHLSKIFVKVGDKLKRGNKIAAVGNTGRSTGPHLHYEVRLNNIPQNPRRYILD